MCNAKDYYHSMINVRAAQFPENDYFLLNNK